MNHSRPAIALIIFLGSFLTAHTQTELAIIPLDPSLESVREMRHFKDDQGNVLFNFMGNGFSQFILLKGDSLASSKTLYLKERYQFLKAIYDKNFLTLFYRNKKEKEVYFYYSDMQTLPELIVNAGTRQGKKKALADVYHQGDFLTINYTRKPFTLHIYRHQSDQAVEKEEQVFANRNSGKQFLGRIQTNEEIIFVRYSMSPLTLHFYRYFQDRGFEKTSVSVDHLYKARGLNPNRGINIKYGNFYNADRRLGAFIEGEDIYLDMTEFLPFGPGTGNKSKLSAGILHLNWATKEPQLLSVDAANDKVFVNRKFDLLDNRYYKLLVNRNQLELSIYDVQSQSLLKKYAYTANQNIDLIYGFAQQNKKLHGNIRLLAGVSITPPIGYRNIKGLNTKELLKNLSGESLSFIASKSGDIIKLQISGTDHKGVFVNKSETASFVGFLNSTDLKIIEQKEESIDPIFTTINEYIAQLEEEKRLGDYNVYFHQDKIYLAYIDKSLNCCKIIVFTK